MWKKILLVIVIIYLVVAIVNVAVFGWEGLGHFFVSPFYSIGGAIEGIIDGISNAPESYRQGQQAADAALNR